MILLMLTAALESVVYELVARLSHIGPIFKNDNTSVFMKVEKATHGTSIESTVKAFSRRKDGRGAFLALVANHAGDTKYRAILKKCMNLLQNIKWNGRAYPLETHVSNHRQSVNEIRECSTHITATVLVSSTLLIASLVPIVLSKLPSV